LALVVHVKAAVLPAGTLVTPAPVGVDATAVPPTWMEQPFAAVLEVPLFVKVIMQFSWLGPGVAL